MGKHINFGNQIFQLFLPAIRFELYILVLKQADFMTDLPKDYTEKNNYKIVQKQSCFTIIEVCVRKWMKYRMFSTFIFNEKRKTNEMVSYRFFLILFILQSSYKLTTNIHYNISLWLVFTHPCFKQQQWQQQKHQLWQQQWQQQKQWQW